MASITELIELQQHQRGQINQGGGSGVVGVIANIIKQNEDEKRRQANVKKQMSQSQEMMKAMSQMVDNSSSAKAIGSLDNKSQASRKGIIKVSDFVPEQSMSTDEMGNVNVKFGYRRATPAEQKAQFEIQKSQIEMEKAAAKDDLLRSYISGEVQEGAILKEMSTLGITADEFDIASQARERMRNVSQTTNIPQGFEATEMTRDRMGNLIPSGIKKIEPPMSVAQPTEMDKLREEQARLNIEKTRRELAPQEPATVTQEVKPAVATTIEAPFRFKTEKTVAEQKFEAEKAETEKKLQLESEMVKESAQDTLDTINEIENGIKYFGAAGNLPAFPGEYEKENWQANIDKLQSKLVVDLMNRMKQASRTGATGFGQLSEKELKVLQNAATALKKGMSEEYAAKYLNQIKEKAQKVLGAESQSSGNGTVPSVGGTFNGEKVISVKRIR